MIEWLAENWYYIVAVIVCAIGASYGVMTGKVKEWLKFAVTIAEKDLGSGTGQLKLRQVYSMFVDTYPAFAVIVPFSIFSKWVDVSLEWLKIQLDSNNNVQKLVGVEDGK